jgi:DNA-binding GntR family transcriptional regulator
LYAISQSVRRAYDAICDGIIAGRYRPGSHLREVSLAEEIGVSRTPVREALRRLSAEGFVEHRPNQGTFVRQWSDQSLAEIADMRGHLGRAAGELAARHATIDDIATLRATTVDMAATIARGPAAAAERMAHLTVAFITQIFAIAGNDWMLQTIRQTSDLPTIRRRFLFAGSDDWRRLDFYHHEIIDALDARDATWAGAMVEAYFRVTKHMSLRSYERARDAATGAEVEGEEIP